jgi:hypothetical protein
MTTRLIRFGSVTVNPAFVQAVLRGTHGQGPGATIYMASEHEKLTSLWIPDDYADVVDALNGKPQAPHKEPA